MKKTKVVLSIMLALILVGSMLGIGYAKNPQADSLSLAVPTLQDETFLPWNGSNDRQMYLLMIYDCLTYIDPVTREVKPGLAERWEMSSDAKTWTFWIRKGVRFQEGWGELTAEDVKFTIEKILDPKSVATGANPMRKLVKKVEAPEPYKIVYHLEQSYVGLLTIWLHDELPGMVACKKYVESVGEEKANDHPIGSGPYTLAEEHKSGQPIKLTTIPDVEKHWRVKPEYKNVTFLVVPEEVTRVAMLKSGEVDLAPINYDSLEDIKKSGLHIFSVKKNWSPHIRMGGLIKDVPERYKADNPWAKKEIRQALNYAIDKESICRNLFSGEAVPAAATVPVDVWKDLPPYPYDPAKAKKLLADAGYPDGFSIVLKTFKQVPGAQLPIIGEIIAMNWKDIGIDVKIIPTEWGSVMSEITAGKNLDYVWLFRDLAFLDPMQHLDLAFSLKNIRAAYETPESTNWYNKIAAELDIEKRNQLFREFGLWMHEEAPFIWLVFVNQPYGASKKVGKWQPSPIIPCNVEYITSQP